MNIPIQCPGCGQTLQIPEQFAGQTGKCQHCGGAITVPTPATAVFGAAQAQPVQPRAKSDVGKAIVYGFGGCLGVGIAIGAAFFFFGALASSTTKKAREARPEGITLEEFNAIAIGMDYQTVWRTVGGPGTVQSDSTFGAGTHYQTIQATYSWKAESGFGNASVSFKDGQATSKHQFGLDR